MAVVERQKPLSSRLLGLMALAVVTRCFFFGFKGTAAGLYRQRKDFNVHVQSWHERS